MALSDQLEVYYELEEASGTRVDSHGSEDLTEFGSVGSNTGKQGDAAEFSGGVASLAIQNSTVLEFGADDDFTVCCWVYLDTEANYRIIFSRSNPDAPTALKDLLMRLYYDVASDRWVFSVGNGTSGAEVTANNFGAVSTGAWQFIACWHDKTANQIAISVNDGTPDTASWSGGTQGGGTNTYFRLGDQNAGGFYHDGRIDEFGFWKGRVLSSSEITELYNSGNGRDYAYVSGGGATVYSQFWWNLAYSYAGAM